MSLEQCLRPYRALLSFVINCWRLLIDLQQVAVHRLLRHAQHLPRRIALWRAVWRRRGWLSFWRAPKPSRFRRRSSSWNRTSETIEKRVVELKSEHPHLGIRQLSRLLERLALVRLAPETIRRILLRCSDLAVPRRIHVSRPRRLWGVDLTTVYLFGLFPVTLLGVIDYYGSRLITLEQLENSKSATIAAALERAIQQHGAPKRILTDRGANLAAPPMQAVFDKHDIDHTRTKPRHPWTNGRIERLFRTFKETVFRYIWKFTSVKQVDRYCADFVQFYNRDRPHSAWSGRTPDEVYFHRRPKGRSQGRVTYFDGHLCWYKFG